jgi:hypothetical protein
MTMQGDSSSHPRKPPSRDLWKLPRIEKVTIQRVRYQPPRKHVIGGRVVEFAEGVEILVQTDGEIPVRALSPALNVGDAEVVENERAAEGAYRFFVLDEEALDEGAPISLGWVGVPKKRGKAKFRYRAPGGKRGR